MAIEAYPKKLILGVTRRCNLQCVMCVTHGENKNNYSEDLPDLPESYFSALDILWPHLEKLEFGGIGEPLLYPGFMEKLKHIRQKNTKLDITLYTNGLLLNSEEQLKELYNTLDTLHISINGLKTYELIMQGSSWEILNNNVARLAKLKQASFKKTQLLLGCVLFEDNFQESVALTEYAIKNKFDGVVFKDLWLYPGFAEQRSLRRDEQSLLRLKPYMEQAYQLAQQQRLTFVNEFFPELSVTGAYYKQPVEEDQVLLPTGCLCSDPWTTMQISYKGEAWLCCNRMTRIGFMRDQTIPGLWFSTEAANYRRGLLQNQYYKECQYCKKVQPQSLQAYMRK